MNNTSFFIPPFQRAYAWGNQEIDRFFDDVERVILSEQDESEKDKQEHFFGVLVFKTEADGFGSRDVIVDGQQRLTTTLLMLIALRDSVEDSTIKSHIEKNYLTNENSTYNEKIKLKQVTSDWDAYRALVRNSDGKISGRLTEGYLNFLSKIASRAYPAMAYINALSKINVACIFLDERPYKGEDPQVIFETLNSLGKPLSLADLIRNYVLLDMTSIDQTNIFEKIWHPRIEEVLRTNNSHFFRDYLQYKESKYFKVVSDNNTKELYALFKKFVEGSFRNNKKAFIDDICRYVSWYQWITETNATAVISNNPDNNSMLVELLRNIFHDIRADAFKPFVLGLLEYHQAGFNGIKLPDHKLIEALEVVRTYLIRRRVLKLTQGENKEIARLCEVIRGNASIVNDTKSELLKLLSAGAYRLRFPNDTEVARELERIDFYNGLSKYRKLILGKIEEQISKVSVDFRNEKITIEHIMPQSTEKSEAWKNELGDGWEETYRTYLHNIGNLILTEFNGEMGRKPLGEKKEILQDSNLSYRHDVINRSTWNSADIVSHQTEMIERFLLTFPLPANMQSADNWDARVTVIQEVFSPLEDDTVDVATGRKPKAILINDELYETATWQDVYLIFLRWVSENLPIVLSRVLNQHDGDFFGRHPFIVTCDILNSIIENDPEMNERYKRLSDGTVFSKLSGQTIDDDIFVFINQSAKGLINRVGQVMKLAEMPEESVVIELK